jgi:hypothetical protein
MTSASPVPAHSTTKRNRHTSRSSLACVRCKNAKRKCDLPERLQDRSGCSNCAQKGELCEVRFGEDKRCKKRKVESQSRAPDVENPTQEEYPSVPPKIVEGITTATPILEQLGNGVPLNEIPISTPHLQQPYSDDFENGPCKQAENTNQEPSLNPVPAEFEASPPNYNTPLQFATQAQSPIPLLNGMAENNGSDASSAIISRIIARQSGLESQDRDDIEYFGATSIFHLSNGSQTAHQTAASTAVKTLARKNRAREIVPDLDCCNEPEPIVTHLLDLFWTWQASHLQVVHREHFLAHKKLHEENNVCQSFEYYSPGLLFAIMSIAAMVSTDRGVRRYSTREGGIAGDIFFEKSKTHFDAELGSPSITTVQTALLLGSRYGAADENSLGWTYSGEKRPRANLIPAD